MTTVSVFAPTPKQTAYYRRLCDAPELTADERTRCLAWLEAHATLHRIKDQIDQIKDIIARRRQMQRALDQWQDEAIQAVRDAYYGDALPRAMHREMVPSRAFDDPFLPEDENEEGNDTL